MSAPVISSINTLQQGQGQSYLPKLSVVEIEVNFSTTGNALTNFLVELSLDGGVTYYTATCNAIANGQNVIPPVGAGVAMIVIDVTQTWINLSLTPGVYTNCKVRLTATANSLSSTPFVSTQTITIKSTRPVITSISMASWVGEAQAYSVPVAITATDDTGSGQTLITNDTGYLYRNSTAPSSLGGGTPLSFAALTSTVDIDLATVITGTTVVYFAIYDQYYNASSIASVSTSVQLTSPSNCIITITGQQGNPYYTGIQINDDGSFTPNRTVTINVSCTSTFPGIPLFFQILPNSNVELTSNVGVTYPLIPANSQQQVNLTTNQANPTADNFNQDATCVVSVKFSDAAGNFTDTNQTIRLNTRIYLTAYKPLEHAAGDYSPDLYYISSGGVNTNVPQQMIMSTNAYRAWPDIFYPVTHGYPTNADGSPDLTVIAADPNLSVMISTPTYDALLLTSTPATVYGQPPTITLVLDSDNRPITTDWTVNGTKNYNDMESSSLTDLNYWVIDNTLYGNLQLEFEYFYLDTGIWGPPYNPISPYRGDVLMVYDATAPGALTQVTGANGAPTWILSNTTLLRPLFAYTAGGPNVVDLISGVQVNATAQGSFTSNNISAPLIVMMLFSDCQGTASGFKLKSGPAHDSLFTNYDVDEINGQVWVHLFSTISDQGITGSADNTTKELYYNYIVNPATVNLETGIVTFPSPAIGEVTVDYSYYANQTPPSNTFISSADDFVYYNQVQVFVVPSGSVTCTPTQKVAVYETAGYGNMISGATWDMDRGIVTISPPPSGEMPINQRMTTDVFYHTYKRVTSDNYGDITFHDPTLVPDIIPNYPDYTWADVKIVNEGDASLMNMEVTFVARGYDTNGDGQVVLTGANVVDQVLDINRPWDIQLGTSQETYQVMAMGILSSYLWVFPCPRTGGNGSTGSSGATAILQTWGNGQAPAQTIAARSNLYGRVVWVLGGTSGSAYPASVTAGVKRTSVQINGTFYSSFVL